MSKGKYQIPFDKNGNMLDYPDWLTEEWRDNYIFADTLTYIGYSRGRSSATIRFEDSKGKTYSMFLSDFDDMMKDRGFNGVKAKGQWTFVKKGQNYGVKLALEVK